MTNKNIIIGVIIILAIILIYNFLKKKPDSGNDNDDKSDSNQADYSPGNISGGSSNNGESSTSVITSPSGPVIVNPQIGKTAYSLGTNTPVFNDVSLQSVYKYAKKDEWIGTILSDVSVGSSTSKLWWKTSGGKIVSKGSVYVK